MRRTVLNYCQSLTVVLMTFVFVLAMPGIGIAQTTQDSSTQRALYKKHQYFVTQPMTWGDAKKAAAAVKNGHLVTIDDAAEQAWLTKIFGNAPLWIGLTDEVSEGNFVWDNGEPVSYYNWKDLGPDGFSGENYVSMGPKWDDQEKDKTYPAIIEIDQTVAVDTKPAKIYKDLSVENNSYFGSGIDIEDNKVLIGARKDNNSVQDAGSVFLYDRDTKQLKQSLVSDYPLYSENFGRAVDLEGNLALVGADGGQVARMYCSSGGSNPRCYRNHDRGGSLVFVPRKMYCKEGKYRPDYACYPKPKGDYPVTRIRTSVINSGDVYLFNLSTGKQTLKFKNPNAAPLNRSNGRKINQNDYFGFDVGMDSDKALIGAYGNKSYTGAAYLYDLRDQGKMLFELKPPSAEADSYFGYSVSLQGDRAVIGAPKDDVGKTSNAGTAFLYDTTTGKVIQNYDNPHPKTDDQFGYDVALDKKLVVIGAPYDDTRGTDSGAAYVYDRATGDVQLTLYNPRPNTSDQFGASVEINGDRVLVSAPNDDKLATDAGLAYLFDAKSGDLLKIYGSPIATDQDYFGYSMDINGQQILLGTNAPSGEVYLFNDDTATTEVIVDIDGVKNASQEKPFKSVNGSSAVQVPLTPGTYTIKVISTANGGQYDSFNRNNGNVENCKSSNKVDQCDKGWENKYLFDIGSKSTVIKGINDRHNSVQRAQKPRVLPPDYTLNLTQNSNVKFYVKDPGKITNNKGGVSLKITKK